MKKGFAIKAEQAAYIWDYAVIQATPPEGPDPALVFKQLILCLKVCWNHLYILEDQPKVFHFGVATFSKRTAVLLQLKSLISFNKTKNEVLFL